MGKLAEFKNHLLVGGTRFIDVRGFWLRNEMEAMQRLPKYADPLNLVPYGRKMFSQNDEDGITIEIFNRIGTTNKTFVEGRLWRRDRKQFLCPPLEKRFKDG